MTDFLLELRCEEIPARMQAKASEDLARLFTQTLAEAGLEAASITSYVTPRRLVLIAHDLPQATQAVREETKGPATAAPEQALEGFLRKTGLTKDQLEVRDIKGKDTWFAVVEKPGRATADVLAEAIPGIIRAFPWPKSMRWGHASLSSESLRWVRPLQGIVALLGTEVVPFAIEGIETGRETVGHRFHSHHPVSIDSPASYAEQLRTAHVIVDPAERAQIIEAEAHKLAHSENLVLVPDAGLVAENAGLTEWPVPLLGHFDSAFLEVPPEVIQLTLRINQKYFVLRDKHGALAPAFICTANIVATDGGKAIVDGNGKVLAARLSDARFFWEQDKKTPLAEQAKKLERITFHEKLGTVADKVERVARLAEWLASEGIVPNCDPKLARQAAELCKADLVTEMVGEFPELQGLMGGYYARAEGLPDAVADAIRDHYGPVGQGDEVPTEPVTVAVSLADKLDTLVGFFGIDELPTGSKDPFALRRAAISILALQIENLIRFEIGNMVEEVVKTYRPQGFERALAKEPIIEIAKVRRPIEHWRVRVERGEGAYLIVNDQTYGPFENDAFREFIQENMTWGARRSTLKGQVTQFFADRLKVQQREAGVRHDLIDAVFALGGEDDLVRLLARVKALQDFIGTDDGTNLLAGYKRAANILKKENWDDHALVTGKTGEEDPMSALDDPDLAEALRVHEHRDGAASAASYTPEPAEAALIAALDMAEPRAEAAIAAEDFGAAMAALATLRAPIDTFFDDVTVNDPDPAKRESRLNLLTRIRTAVHKVADFSKIEG